MLLMMVLLEVDKVTVPDEEPTVPVLVTAVPARTVSCKPLGTVPPEICAVILLDVLGATAELKLSHLLVFVNVVIAPPAVDGVEKLNEIRLLSGLNLSNATEFNVMPTDTVDWALICSLRISKINILANNSNFIM